MNIVLDNAAVYKNGKMMRCNAYIGDGVFRFSDTSGHGDDSCARIVSDCMIFPGFCDVHVHLREPGFSYKETIASGTAAAAHGGYTAVCSMPNLNPAPDSAENLSVQLELIKKNAKIAVYPYGTITKGEMGKELCDMESIASDVVAFSDDGRGVQEPEIMERAMLKAKSLGKIIAAHCEDNKLLRGGYIHDGEYARLNSMRGICSESEWGQIKRDIALAEKTGAPYHVCHISTKESVALIRDAKKRGVDITCETAPHYLVLDDMMLRDEGRFKMNPPVRSQEDRLALIEGIQDGTIDMIATDHAPHSLEEKSRGLEKSAMGVVGLETAFPVLYTQLVAKNIISVEKLIELLAVNPRKRFGIPLNDDEWCIWDVKNKYEIKSESFLSMGKASPFTGMSVLGAHIATIYGGKSVL